MADGEVRAQDLAQETASTLSGNEQFVMFDSTAGKRADIDDVATYVAGDKTTLKTTNKTSPVAAINENFDAIADVKEDIENIIEQLGYNVAYIPVFTQGGYYTTDGNFVSISTWGYTPLFEVNPNTSYYLNVPTSQYFTLYDENENVVSSGMSAGTMFITTSATKYARISVINTRQQSCIVTEGSEYISNTDNIYKLIDKQKSDISILDNIANIDYDEASKNIRSSGWVIILDDIHLTSGGKYNFIWSIKNAIESAVSINLVDSEGTYIFSGNISGGTTSKTLTYTADASKVVKMRAYIGASFDLIVTAKYELVDKNIADKIDEVSNSIFDKYSNINTGMYAFRDDSSGKYVNVSNNDFVIDSGDFKCVKMECEEGDTFIINGYGGSGNALLYGFVRNIEPGNTKKYLLAYPTPQKSSSGMQYEYVIAPAGSKYALFNFSINSDNYVVKVKNVDALAKEALSSKPKNHIRFMVFGNSYGMDSITYVPFILKNLGITSEIYLYRRDACSLRDIYNRWESDSATDTETDGIHAGTYGRTVYNIDTRVDTSWRVHQRISMKDCVELGGWDFITLQQWSAYSIDESTYYPWLPLDIDLIRQSVDKATMLAWTQVCTRATHDDKTASITAFKNVPYDKFPFDFYIPYGTAIFNARANESLALLGDYSGHNLWKDGVHLQDGLPRYIAALTVCEAICRKFFPNISVMYDKTRPTDNVISAWGNYMAMTPSVGITEANCLLAQYSAINACNHMFTITPTESLPTPPND